MCWWNGGDYDETRDETLSTIVDKNIIINAVIIIAIAYVRTLTLYLSHGLESHGARNS